MIRQYKIHTNLDGTDNRIFDVTNGKLRFYSPSNLGITISNNIWSANGIGVKGNSSLSHPDITFGIETFGDNISENYELLTDFIQTLLKLDFVTLEYTTENFTVYADLALSEQTKTEGYGKNGTFSETISFQAITKWYTFEKLTFTTIENGEFNVNYSKIYNSDKYVYSDIPSYTYFGESNVQRFSSWVIDDGIFSFTARMTPATPRPTDNKYGLRFLDDNFNEYTAIILNLPTAPTSISFNTDVNDEYYNAIIGTNVVNQFPALDFSRFRTRIFQHGKMELVGVADVEMSVKKKVDFI